MNPSELYINALVHNNSGVLRLESGNFEGARDSFRNALDTLSQAVSLGVTTYECNATFQWSNNAPLINNNSSTPEAQMTFVYKRAVVMIPGGDEQQTTKSTSFDFSEESAAILFNMALTHHLMGLAANRTDILERSLKFYEISNSIRQHKDQKAPQHLDVLDLAIANNVGHAQHEFCNYGTARECFDLVTSRLQQLNCQGMICTLEQCDCEGFVLNAMMEQPTLAAAA